jgi:hypothetical protein
MSQSPRILYCHCAHAQVVPAEVKAAVLRRLSEAGIGFEAVADLCEMSARKDSSLARLAEAPAGLKIAACYPRAVKWLFAATQAPLALDRTEVLNMRAQSADEIVAALLQPALHPNLPAGKEEPTTPPGPESESQSVATAAPSATAAPAAPAVAATT